MAIMFITHNLGVVAQMTEDVIVMYMGKVVESASVDAIFHNAKHPVHPGAPCALHPAAGQKTQGRRVLELDSRDRPGPLHPAAGVCLHPRCSMPHPGYL